MNKVKRYIVLFLGIVLGLTAYAQPKLNTTFTLPSAIDVCGDEQSITIRVRNITTSTVSGITATVEFNSGLSYVTSSVSGGGVTENSTTNPQKPVFNIPNLSLAQSADFTVKVAADCDLVTFLNNGGIAKVKVTCAYTGGSSSNTSLPLTVNQPAINVTGITNQYYVGGLGDQFVRKIEIKNSGSGALKSFTIDQTFQAGLQIDGIGGGTITKSGSVYTSDYDTSDFKQIGDNDALFEKGEVVYIYDTLTIASCANLSASIKLTWGCQSKSCKTLNYNTQVSLLNRAPKLDFQGYADNNYCFDPNQPLTQSLRIINSGDDTATNTEVVIFQGVNTGFYKSELSYIDTTTLVMQVGQNGAKRKVRITKAELTNTNGILSCLGAPPVGYMELAIGDILKGDTIYLSWESKTCCPTTCFSSFYAHRWKYEATYEDQCDKVIKRTELFGSYGMYHGFAMSSYTPSDMVEGDTSKFSFTVTAASFIGNSAYSELKFVFKRPAGTKHSTNKSDFEFRTHDGKSWQPTTITQTGDSVIATFKGRPTISMINADLIVKLITDCSSSSANSDETYSLNAYYTADTRCTSACAFQNYCFTGKIRIHCDNVCRSGLKFGDFDVERISYGKPDNDNDGLPDTSGSLDMDNIRLERVMYGDTLQTVFRGRVNRLGSTTQWSRLSAKTTMNYGKFLTVAEARIRILRSGVQLYSCTGIDVNTTTSGNSRTFNYDLSVTALINAKCPLYSGFRYLPSDSVELYVKYVVSTNPGNFFNEVQLDNEFYLHTVASPASYQKYQCDSFSGRFMLAGYYLTTAGRNIYSANGCGDITVSQNYYLSIGRCCGNYAGGNLFPREYRKWAKPKKLLLIPPRGFDVMYSNFYHYRTAGTGARSYQFTDSLTPSKTVGDTVFYDIDSMFTDKKGPLIISDDGFFGVWYSKLRANCEAPSKVDIVQYGFEFQELDYLGSDSVRIFSGSGSDELNYNAPILGVKALSKHVNAQSDTAEWQIIVDNSSSLSEAKHVWLAQRPNGNTQIISVWDTKTKQYVPTSNGIFQLGDILASKNQAFIVRAIFSKCDRDSFNIYLGHDCGGYPESFGKAKCVSINTLLSYTPQNTNLSASISTADSVIDLCAETSYSVNVQNLGEARAFDLSVDLYLQSGMILIDTAYVFIPGLADSFMVTNPINMGGGQMRWNVSQGVKFLDTSGLAGVTSVNPNQYTLKFKLSTNCDFVSSSYFLVKPEGRLRCGLEVLSSFIAGKPMDVRNVSKPYFSFLTFDKKKIDACNYDGVGAMKFINLGPDTTGTNDYIQLILPDGIYLDTTYMVGLHNTPKNKPSVKYGVRYTAYWKIPSGLQAGDSVNFLYKTYIDGARLSCGNTQILAQSVVSQPALCVKDSSYCDIDVSTSSDLLIDSIQKAVYNLDVTQVQSVPGQSGEQISLTYDLRNVGSPKEDGVLLEVKIVADSNGNGTIDAGDFIVSTDTITDSLATSLNNTRQMQFSVNPFFACKLFMVIDSTNCVCSPTYQKIGDIRLINAGPDTVGCSYEDIPIGMDSMENVTYRWLNANKILDSTASKTTFNIANKDTRTNTYKLVLQSTRGGCTSSDTTLVSVYPAMIANLPDTQVTCIGGRVLLGDIPTGGVGFKKYQWTPSDSLTNPTGVKPFANPTVPTTYTITITDEQGCTFVDSTHVKVVTPPTAGINYSDTCIGIGYSIDNSSTAGSDPIDSSIFHFSNGDEFINQKPGFIPPNGDSVWITLQVFDAYGCSDADTVVLTPFELPTASFTTTSSCAQDSVVAINQSQAASGGFSSSWYVNGDTITTQNLSMVAQSVGSLPIRLEVISDQGCAHDTTQIVSISDAPKLSISTENVCLGGAVRLQATVQVDSGNVVSSEWRYNNASIISNVLDTTYIFSSAGTFTVNFKAITDRGCSDSINGQVFIHPNPQASFTVNDVCIGDTVFVQSTSTLSSGNIVDYKLGVNGNYASGDSSNALYFNAPGDYSVDLIVHSDSGCVDTATTQIARVKHKEVPQLSVAGNCAYSPINFALNVNYADSIANVHWNNTGLDTNTSGLNLNKRVFTQAGIDTLHVTLSFVNGCSTDTTFDYTIDPKPIASFNYNLPCSDNEVEFSSTSSTSAGTITRYNWSLGDGNTSSIEDFVHRYQGLNNFDVVHIVENEFGCNDTTTQQVLVEYIVVPDFIVSNVCLNDSVYVETQNSGVTMPIQSSVWDMGDGNTVTTPNQFYYTYQAAGTYNITYSFETNPGCQYDTVKQVEIYDLPVPGFDKDPDQTNITNSDITITSTASGAVSHLYTIGSIYETKDADFVFHFPDSGTYLITQTVTNEYGCEAQYTDEVTIDFIVNILVPNAFHPDLDDLNEVFGPMGVGIKNFELSIYDRWGGCIYRTSEGKYWDGDRAPLGVYMYTIKVTDYQDVPHFFSGIVHLIR